MTLNTRVMLDGPITGREAFELALGAILDAANRGDERTTAIVERNARGSLPKWTDRLDPEMADRHRYRSDFIRTQIGQGLPGIVECKYIEGGRLEVEWDDEDTDEPWQTQRACAAEISWDTAYGYKDNGLTCTMLHVSALIHLRDALPEGVTMRWQNEFTGEWHDGLEEEDLKDFLGGGDSAMEWFNGAVVPYIESQGGTVDGR